MEFKNMLGHINTINSSLTTECVDRINQMLDEVFPEPTYPLNIDQEIKKKHEDIRKYGRMVMTNAIHFDILQYRKIQYLSVYRNVPVVKMCLSQIHCSYDNHGIITPIVLAKDSVDQKEPIKVFLK